MIAFPSILAVIWVALMMQMPESPRWYIVKGNHVEAYNVFCMIYDTTDDARRETDKVISAVESLRLSTSGMKLANYTPSESRLSTYFSSSGKSINSNVGIGSSINEAGANKDVEGKSYLPHGASVWEVINLWKLSIFVSVALMVFQNFSGHLHIV